MVNLKDAMFSERSWMRKTVRFTYRKHRQQVCPWGESVAQWCPHWEGSGCWGRLLFVGMKMSQS